MRFFPVHIIAKDLFFYLTYLSVNSMLLLSDPLAALLLTLRLASGLLFIDLFIGAVLYFNVRRYFRFRSFIKSYGAGMLLHLPLMLAWMNSKAALKSLNFWIAFLLSAIFSGLLYALLNQKDWRRKFHKSVSDQL